MNKMLPDILFGSRNPMNTGGFTQPPRCIGLEMPGQRRSCCLPVAGSVLIPEPDMREEIQCPRTSPLEPAWSELIRGPNSGVIHVASRRRALTEKRPDKKVRVGCRYAEMPTGLPAYARRSLTANVAFLVYLAGSQ